MSESNPRTCPQCGGADLAAGNLVWNGPIRFKASDQGGFRRGEIVEARACRTCGHISLFVDPPAG